MINLDQARASLGEPPRQKAVGGEGSVARMLDTVHVENVLRLLAEHHSIRARMVAIAKRHFKCTVFDERWISDQCNPRPSTTHPLNFLDDLALGALADTFRVAHIMNRVAGGLKLDAFKFGGQETAFQDHWRADTGCTPLSPSR